MFVIQRVLETEGKLTLLDQSKVLTPHPFFRIFATANTVGLEILGIYHETIKSIKVRWRMEYCCKVKLSR